MGDVELEFAVSIQERKNFTLRKQVSWHVESTAVLQLQGDTGDRVWTSGVSVSSLMFMEVIRVWCTYESSSPVLRSTEAVSIANAAIAVVELLECRQFFGLE
jgi:hypothetical protein